MHVWEWDGARIWQAGLELLSFRGSCHGVGFAAMMALTMLCGCSRYKVRVCDMVLVIRRPVR